MPDVSRKVLTRAVLNELAAHAEEVYPKECCGFVLADGTVHRATNIQDQLFATQGDRFFRTSSNG